MNAFAILLGVIAAGFAQEPTAQQSGPQTGETATQLQDIIVQGRSLDELVADFVSETAAPARGRGLARWRDHLCVGVVNLRPEAAQYIADRVSQIALDLGLVPGEPGCRANVIIVFTTDGAELTAQLAEEYRLAFRSRAGGMERGDAAFMDFVASRRPVKWWHVSMPTDAETGRRAIRLPGEVNNRGGPSAPELRVFAASRLNTQIRDDMRKAMVIVDVDELDRVSLGQLADYLAFISLAQIDPNADVGTYDTILKLFAQPTASTGLTEWDRSYLTSLYEALDAPQFRRNPSAVSSGVAGVMSRDRVSAREQDTESD